MNGKPASNDGQTRKRKVRMMGDRWPSMSRARIQDKAAMETNDGQWRWRAQT